MFTLLISEYKREFRQTQGKENYHENIQNYIDNDSQSDAQSENTQTRRKRTAHFANLKEEYEIESNLSLTSSMKQSNSNRNELMVRNANQGQTIILQTDGSKHKFSYIL